MVVPSGANWRWILSLHFCRNQRENPYLWLLVML